MSVPLDRLYNFLHGLCNHDIVISYFKVHGSRNLMDTDILYPIEFALDSEQISMICHDQEPLELYRYTLDDFVNRFLESSVLPNTIEYKNLPAIRKLAVAFNLRICTRQMCNIWDKTLLVHSEQRSVNVKLYEKNDYIGVYWWSHAAIARDWFRYAEHDLLLETNLSSIQHDFLIYNRAWSGTREYRLKFVESLANANLLSSCLTTFSEHDGIHYTEHQFNNQDFKIVRNDLHTLLPTNVASSASSADYTATDYQTCGIEVVLETLFDDTRLHLTEKALRPIACGRPFMLVATHGSLEYLRQYGFKTFDGLINETYDTIVDPVNRLEAVVAEMQKISAMPAAEKAELFKKLYAIAEFNKELFFSKQFHNSIFDEFKQNVSAAIGVLKKYKTGKYSKLWTELYNELPDIIQTLPELPHGSSSVPVAKV